MQILPQSSFRLLKEYKKHLPNINENTIFAFAGNIYSNNPLPEDLIIHEQTHFKQQAEYGLQVWVKRYLNEKDFRLEMEKEAYISQISSIKNVGLRDAVIKDSINALTSGLYGKVNKEQAEQMLKEPKPVDLLIPVV